MRHPKQSEHRLKLNRLIAKQAYSNMLERKQGIVSCCPPPDKERGAELFELKEMLDSLYPEMDQDDSMCFSEYTICAELLIQKINLL